MRSVYASVLVLHFAGQVDSVPSAPRELAGVPPPTNVHIDFPIGPEGSCLTTTEVEQGTHHAMEILNRKLQEIGANIVVTFANAPREDQTSSGLNGREIMCPGKFFNPSSFAGHTCFKFADGNEFQNFEHHVSRIHGDSIEGFTEEQCVDEMHGYWTPYICEGTEYLVTLPEVQASPELLDFFVQVWSPTCCTDELQGGLVLKSNNAGGSANTFRFNRQNIFSSQNIFGDVPEGTKIFAGHLVISVNNPVALIGKGTANNTVKEALKAGIAKAVAGVETSMVKIMRVHLPQTQRRLASSSRSLSADVTVNYMIKVPRDSSLTAGQIESVGNQFTPAFNSQFQSAGITVAVEATQSPAPSESLASAASTSVALASTIEGSSFTDACHKPAASMALALALVLATVLKSIV